jgi:hypothetical protein
VNGEVSNANLEITLTGSAPNGWIYIRVNDPGKEQFTLKKVTRSDGRDIRLEDNAWTTHRTIRLTGESPYRENLLHLFDYVELGNFKYTLRFEGELTEPKPPVLHFISDRSMVAGIHFGFIVKASDPNGTIPVLSAYPIPERAAFKDNGNGEGRFDWPTTEADTGKYEIKFTASDGELSESQTVTITIYSGTDDDSDGMSDGWEMEYFKTLDRDGEGDFDNDGITDRNEYLSYTDPLITITTSTSSTSTTTTTTSSTLSTTTTTVSVTTTTPITVPVTSSTAVLTTVTTSTTLPTTTSTVVPVTTTMPITVPVTSSTAVSTTSTTSTSLPTSTTTVPNTTTTTIASVKTNEISDHEEAGDTNCFISTATGE